MDDKQLHRPLNESASLPVNIDMQGELIFKSVGGLPCFYYPSGEFCFAVSAYLQTLCFDKNHSLTLKGGSLSQYAFLLSPLVRFLRNNDLSWLDLTDSYFELFIGGLEVKVNGERVRGNPKVREIGSRSLDFLHFTSAALGYPNFVSPDGVICGYRVSPEDRKSFHQRYHKLEWYHHSFPSGGSDKKRFPISEEAITSLRDQANKQSKHLKARMLTMLSVFEYSGARRIEVSRIRVSDVVRAHQLNDANPLVRFETVKQGTISFRFVPIPRVIVSSWIKYIETSRMEIIDKTIGLNKDHGFLFVSINKGAPISADTITNDIHDLKVLAGLRTPAHAHLFRHRFITEQLKNLIVTYGLVNNASVRSILASSELLKLRLKEWSGHRKIESLDSYIKVAFSELNMVEQVVDAAIHSTSVLGAVQAIERNDQDYARKLISEQEYHKNIADIMLDAVVPFKSWLQSI